MAVLTVIFSSPDALLNAALAHTYTEGRNREWIYPEGVKFASYRT